MITLKQFLHQLSVVVEQEKQNLGFSFHEMKQIGDFNEGLFYDFVLKVEKSDFQVFGGIYFAVELEESEQYAIFGSQDVNDIILDKRTGEILMTAPNESASFFLAPNFPVFLELILILVEYEAIGLKGKAYTKDLKNLYFDKIKSLLKQPKYFTYFKLGLDIQ